MALNPKIITGEQTIFAHSFLMFHVPSCILNFFIKMRREKYVKIYCLYWGGSHTVTGQIK